MAEIFLNNIECKENFLNKNLKIVKYFRYVDDGFILIDQCSDINNVISYFNSLHNKMKFKFEIEINRYIFF